MNVECDTKVAERLSSLRCIELAEMSRYRGTETQTTKLKLRTLLTMHRFLLVLLATLLFLSAHFVGTWHEKLRVLIRYILCHLCFRKSHYLDLV